MKHSDYWKERFSELEKMQNTRSRQYLDELQQQYDIATAKIEKDIVRWHQRFATNNGVSMAEAKKMLNRRELAELKWDVNEYIKYGEQNALDQKWMKQLENASARAHISRLEALKLQTRQHVESLYWNQLDGVEELARVTYVDGVYRTSYELQKGFGIGKDLKLDEKRLNNVMSKPWAADGKNFSERIWGNKTKLTNELHTELSQMCMLGKSPDDAIKNIAKKMGTSKRNAGRLVMTESAFFASAAQKDAFNGLDVERFEVLATLDSRTSAICQELDGKVFEMKDYEVAITAPPFHVNCRSTTVPYFDDFNEGAERAARGEDGKTYYVPADMTYPEWKNSFVDDGPKEGLKKYSRSNGGLGNNHDNKPDISTEQGIRGINAQLTDELKPFGVNNVDFTGMDEQLALDNGKQLIHLQKKYKNQLYNVEVAECLENVYGETETLDFHKASSITLAKSYYSDANLFISEYLNNIREGYHPKVPNKYAGIAVITHEFAHTLSQYELSKNGVDAGFWKEICSIEQRYVSELNKLSNRLYANTDINRDMVEQVKHRASEIFISEYAEESVDEFLAESFTMAHLSDIPSPYALEVLKVVDKYFSRGKRK